MTTSTLVGYARTSTTDQKAGLEAQLRDLNEAGCTKIFQEELSSVDKKRPQLEAILDYVREGDTMIVTKIDRLARSVKDLVTITKTLKEKGVHLRFLANPDMNMDSAQGELIMNIIGAIAQFEREIMLERQKEGIAKAKAEGKYKGREPTAIRKTEEVLKLRAEGKAPMAIAEQLEISRASVFRILRANREAA